jgi:hypothetical protein
LKMGPISSPETPLTTNQRCVTSQNSEERLYTAAEADSTRTIHRYIPQDGSLQTAGQPEGRCRIAFSVIRLWLTGHLARTHTHTDWPVIKPE